VPEVARIFVVQNRYMMNAHDKQQELINIIEEAETKVDFASEVAEMKLIKLISEDPLLHAAYMQYLRVDNFTADDFFIAAIKLLHQRNLKLMSQIENYINHHSVPSVLINNPS
jgi:hypothetical protein